MKERKPFETCYESDFALRDRVNIDGDKLIVGTVTAVLWREDKALIEVSWIHNGDSKACWIEQYRLSLVED